MSLRWSLTGSGWAECTVADAHAQTELIASVITPAPEELLLAVARLVVGGTETSADFEAEPTTFRWRFHRGGQDVWVRLLRLPDHHLPDRAGTQIWSSRQSVTTVARAVVRCFDDVAQRYGESGYHEKWGSSFPRPELEKLRTAWKSVR